MSQRQELAEFILSRSDPEVVPPQTEDISGLDVGEQPMVDFFTHFERFTRGLLGPAPQWGLPADEFAEMLTEVRSTPRAQRSYVGDDDVSALVMLAPDSYALWADPTDPTDAPLYVAEYLFADPVSGLPDSEAYRRTGKHLWAWLAEVGEALKADPELTIDDDAVATPLGYMDRKMLWYWSGGELISDWLDPQQIAAGVLGEDPVAGWVPELGRRWWLVEAFRQTSVDGAANLLEALVILRQHEAYDRDDDVRSVVDETTAAVLAREAMSEDDRAAQLRADLVAPTD